MAQKKEKETEKEPKNNSNFAINWLLAFIIRIFSTCSRCLEAAWRSPNKWSTLTSFCQTHRFKISSCVVCALAYMNNFHYKVSSRLDLDTKVSKVETRGITVVSDLQYYVCLIDGKARALNHSYPLLLRTLECSNAIIWLTIWWNSIEPSYRRPKLFYYNMVWCSIVVWIVLFFISDSGYSPRQDIAEMQLGFFQIQCWMLQMFGQDSMFSPSLDISYYGGELGNSSFAVESLIGIVYVVMFMLFSLLRFIFLLFVVTFHLDMIYRSLHDDAGAQQERSTETEPKASPSPSPESSPASHEEAAEGNPPLDDDAGAQQQSSETESKASQSPSPESNLTTQGMTHEEALSSFNYVVTTYPDIADNFMTGALKSKKRKLDNIGQVSSPDYNVSDDSQMDEHLAPERTPSPNQLPGAHLPGSTSTGSDQLNDVSTPSTQWGAASNSEVPYLGDSNELRLYKPPCYLL